MTFVLTISIGCALLGLCLGLLNRLVNDSPSELVRRVEELLPGIECGQCGYPGCKPYAEAITKNEAPVTLCPPGGKALVDKLSNLLNLDPTGLELKSGPAAFSHVALIDEPACIGCALCVPACPFDAILGAPQAVHTVINEHCTGCELCLPACPVDCISLRPLSQSEALPPITNA